MRIGIVGSGNIGGTLAKLLVEAGHDVMLSNSRGPGSLQSLVAELGAHASAGSVDEAARFGEVVILAAPSSAPLPSFELLAGKIVVDTMNMFGPNYSAYDHGDSSSSEETQKRLSGSRIVKAFNTKWVKHLSENGRHDLPLDERDVMFVAGDDAEAKAIVSNLIEAIGFGPLDTGSLHDGGRRQQPGSDLFNRPMSVAAARRLLGERT